MRQHCEKTGILDTRQPPPTCRRCGECCRKGGPGLHHDDASLVVSGVLPASSLFTLRQGETVLDNVSGRLETLAAEMIRVRPGPDGRACPFFRDPGECLIHDQRPCECRALFCADTTALRAMYQKDRLARHDLAPRESPLGELLAVHEARCPAGEAIRLALAARGDADAGARLAEMLRFDAAFRELAVSRAGLSPDALELYFGRPVEIVVAPFRHGPLRRG
ncbi:YkgJ family cysteine cluster protein [Desulfolutivibrio sulfoxidireducens]|uniref:YkgJ family cysteine cluster protein n=1 Tax=Desulfolutivibrio sulfoxidireducens TaxID=2773299 RepID=UPI00159E2A9B|nr:YkgJ family cysteine cluster protein [Desulfolutivibrio sulfoxidireducens]QLA15133.1 YkgJ family cysteine cluster protein [Desulfolutivibrio sulfoxidireducens]